MFKKLTAAGFALFLLTACGGNTTAENNDASDQPVSIADTENNVDEDVEANIDNKVNNSNNVDVKNPAVSMKEAVAIFLEKYPNAKIESIELDNDRGRLYYDIDGFDESKEYDVEIDATTKEITVNEVETDRNRDDAIDFSSIIDPQEAIVKASAQAEVEGLSPTGWSLEADNGKQKYTIEFEKDNNDIDIEIDATTGEILKVDND